MNNCLNEAAFHTVGGNRDLVISTIKNYFNYEKPEITEFTIGATFLILALTTWPFYLNRHLVLGILTLLYSIQIFNMSG